MKEDQYFDPGFEEIAAQFPLSRRDFLKRLGGGIIVLIAAPTDFVSSLEAQERRQSGYPTDFNAYLRIGEDGRVTCFTGKIEMGQGVVTSLAQELAEELEVSLDVIDMVMGDTDLCPYDRGTFGSMSTRFFGPALRAAGAEAKTVLIELASEHLNIPKDRLAVKEGVVLEKARPSHRVTYAQLAKGKKIVRQLTEKAIVKSAADFKIIGKPVTRRDALEKVTGRAKYAGDIQFPDMVYARILRPPAHGAKLVSVDTTAAQQVDGVQIIRDGDLVAVLHKYPDVAENALKKIKAEFDTPAATVDDKSIFDHLLKVAPEGEVVAEGGDLEMGQNLASEIFEASYLNSYVAHAPIEPHTAVAKFDGDRITVWASTQTPFPARDEIAQALGISAEKVRVITPYVGGGFGGKTRNLQVVEAARLAKLSGKPVQVAWTRAEEFFYDSFRPAAIVKIKSGLAGSGAIVFWDYHVYFAGERGAQHFYDIPHHRTVAHGTVWRGVPGSHPFAVGAWRAPANNTNTFARESQIDLMAAQAGIDPLEFRLKNLKNEKVQGVLKAAAEKFGWKPGKMPSGRGFGVACGFDAGTWVAVIAEVEVDQGTGGVQVKRVVAAQDMGLVINPEGAKIQMEGCVTMGLGYALTEEIHFKGGQIFDLNFDTYELPRFSWLPKIETVLIDSKDPDPQGGGEPVIICMGAVIANAIFDATGVRLFQLPMTPERIKNAMR
ncbi:MAG: molybdopterin-dependent oxidoreductase [candidate division KSB1 bacterium]|nr:molybdopterin-dependent oxidoreductase [candidate division KSB1 bacterium]MDZ7303109.1 molybdopterin-dependent oxidoreductase [candidate division KSB1 bacterium]MDZ7312648.1 molybdopterin-dependent oxidoreductase [candidate division KSB1 bacterium]